MNQPKYVKSIAEAVYNSCPNIPTVINNIILDYISDHSRFSVTGENHYAMLTRNGTIMSFGSNRQGQLENIPKESGYISVGCGSFHTSALHEDGYVRTWGKYNYGREIINVPTTSDFVAIAVGDNHSIGLREDGSVVSWSDLEEYNEISDNAKGSDYIDIYAGGCNSVAVRADGTYKIWGFNRDGQVSKAKQEEFLSFHMNFDIIAQRADNKFEIWGTIPTNRVDKWIDMPGNVEFKSIINSQSKFVGLSTEGKIYAWGAIGDAPAGASQSQFVGLSTKGKKYTWGAIGDVPTGDDFIDIANNWSSSVALRSNGTLVAWSDLDSYDILSQLPTGSDFTSIHSTGYWNVVAMKGKEMIVWGSMKYNQVPGNVIISDFVTMSCSDTYVIAIDSSGNAYIWGDMNWRDTSSLSYNDDNKGEGNLFNLCRGRRDELSSYSGVGFKEVYAKQSHYIIMLKDGSIIGWQEEDEMDYIITEDIPTGKGFTYLSCGTFVSCAIRDTKLYSWGIDFDNEMSISDIPTDSGYRLVQCAFDFVIALKESGKLVAWGSNDCESLIMPDGDDFVEIAATHKHWIALRSNGTMCTGGCNEAYVIEEMPDDNGYTHVYAGINYSVAMRFDGSIVAWGCNYELDDYPRIAGFTMVALGHDHVVLLHKDGTIHSFGNLSIEYLSCPTGNGFVSVFAGNRYSGAIRSDKTVILWGDKHNQVINSIPRRSA